MIKNPWKYDSYNIADMACRGDPVKKIVIKCASYVPYGYTLEWVLTANEKTIAPRVTPHKMFWHWIYL